MSIFTTLLISLAVNTAFFIPAYFFKTDKLTDFSYALTFVIVALISLLAGGVTLPSALLFFAIVIWALRLGGYLFMRIKKIKKDTRFDTMRSNFWQFGSFWFLQAVTAWVVLLPASLFFAKAPTAVALSAFVGLIIWLIGLSIEAVADQQKFVFKSNPANKNKWIATGLWQYSRHPNYFGEILLWLGVYLFVVGSLSPGEVLLGAVGPLFIAFLLIFVSGIPLLEKSADARWGNNPKYQQYKKQTSILIPWVRT